MTPHDFLQSGVAEPAKGFCHLGAAVVAVSFAAYNLAAFAERDEPEPRNLILGLAYLAATGWELRQAVGHFRGH